MKSAIRFLDLISHYFPVIFNLTKIKKEPFLSVILVFVREYTFSLGRVLKELKFREYSVNYIVRKTLTLE